MASSTLDPKWPYSDNERPRSHRPTDAEIKQRDREELEERGHFGGPSEEDDPDEDEDRMFDVG